ncbi:MAG: hypothetical protein AB1402_03655 [Bacillota bacterium]
MKDSREAKSPGNSPATRSPIAEEQLQLARRILEIVREQREALAGKGTVPLKKGAVPLEKGTVPLGPEGDSPPRDSPPDSPSEEALDRFMALAEERQQCMDRFDHLQAVRAAGPEKGVRPLFQLAAQPAGGGSEVEARQVRAAIEVLFREAAEMDAANRQRLEESRDLVRGEIGRARRGRDVLRSYGGREPGGGSLTSGAFVDRKE